MFGGDFFKVFHFVMELLRLIAQVFGDEDDKKGFDNHLSKDRETLKNAANASSQTGKT